MSFSAASKEFTAAPVRSIQTGSVQRSRERYVGITETGETMCIDKEPLHRMIAIKLASQGFEVPTEGKENAADVMSLAGGLFRLFHEQARILKSRLCPLDQRLQNFLDDALKSTGESVQIPATRLILDQYGLAREMSFPQVGDVFSNAEITSYRLSKNGALHNPLNDKRTTKGVFHVADYGLPVPADKFAVPLVAFARLIKNAFGGCPADLLQLPYTTSWAKPVETWISLQLRPLVCPEVPGVRPEKRMETQFFVPGGCIANLDYVESIFGNAGDPNLPENDAGLDSAHWTGTTSCVILAPHLRQMLKKDLGLPNIADATERQKKDGMCWSDPKEKYNGGKPFKLCIRDARGVMITLLADNYFGYCKKEIKTQISYSCNIYGLSEEEHAGGALAFKTVNLGENFRANPRYMQTLVPPTAAKNTHTFNDALKLLGDTVTLEPEGYATDKKFSHVHILPEDMEINLATQSATFKNPATGAAVTLRVKPHHVYVHPSGYKVLVSKHPEASEWRLVGTLAEPVYCHKPSTVSGGGKSELSKSLSDAVIHGPIFIGDYDKDMDIVASIIDRDYSSCILPEFPELISTALRPVLAIERTLGSVIKLLTPDDRIYTAEHNAFVEAIPNHIRAIVFVIKSSYRVEMGTTWRKHYTVDITNGVPGHELKLDSKQLVGSYLRVGLWKNGNWRNFKLRQDFIAADKVQMEDDITASTVVPRAHIHGLPAEYNGHPCLKIAENCEWRLFQRPDDAIHPGFDKQTERDMSGHSLFCSNFEPHSAADMQKFTEELYFFDRLTKPMQDHLLDSVKHGGTNICYAKPRIVDGAPSANVRYLQVRPDVTRPADRYLAEMGARLNRKLSVNEPCIFPVTDQISGRRNNPPDELDDKKIRPLCVYNPVHFQELPELFMDYVCCVTGKSPSTTGAGSEGALSKGPFNAIGATADLNNMLVGMILTGYGGFSSAAGWIGPNYRFDHDISLLVPELWCRMTPEERDPYHMIEKGFLEPVQDFQYEGRTVPASRLGYRITKHFVHYYFCRIFDNPAGVFTEDILRPEHQDLAVFVDGIENIAQAMEKSALLYFEDGIVEDASPPLKAVLHVMAYGHYNGKSIQDPEVRALFTREYLLSSPWYQTRLAKKQANEIAHWAKSITYLEAFSTRPGYESEISRLEIPAKLADARRELEHVSSPAYLSEIFGTLGTDHIHDGYKL